MQTIRPQLLADATFNALELDLRHLPPPEPMLHILEALETLGDGQTLVARTPCRPQPLLVELAADDWHVDVMVAAAGDAWLRISPGDGRAGA